MSTPENPGGRAPELGPALAELDTAHGRERAGLEIEHEVLARFALEHEQDPLGVLGDLLERLRRNQPSERVWTGPGWHRLIAELHERLAQLVPGYTPVQIKEKFGTLRFYVDLPQDTPKPVLEKAQAQIRGAEDASSWMCEVCGRAGHLRGRTRVRTLCGLHAGWGVYE